MSMVAVAAKRRTPISLSKALATLGYEAWSQVDPGKFLGFFLSIIAYPKIRQICSFSNVA